MNEITNDYKNGFNECCDEILLRINQKMDNTYHAHESIYSILLELKEDIIDIAFKNKK